jgi:outer membrane protein assembly factor BamB
MDIRPLLRVLAILALIAAAALGVRACSRWPARRATGIVAGGLAVLALAGFVLSALDVLAPHAPLPDSLSVYYVNDNTLEAASAATGTVRWRYMPPSPDSNIRPNQLPPFANGVFYLRTDGALRAVRARDGQPLWSAPLAGGADQQPPPTVDQGVVYATAAASVVALRATDGRPLWQTSRNATPGSALSAPQVSHGRVYVTFSSGEATVYALDAHDGAIRWTHTVAAEDAALLAVAGGIVYAAFATQKATVVALDAGDGAVRWTSVLEDGADRLWGLTVADGVVLLRAEPQLGLVALDAAAGSLLWQMEDQGDQFVTQFPIVANGVVYLGAYLSVGTSPGMVLAKDARTGRERWRTLLEEADEYVSLAGQMLYVGGTYAYALRASDGHVVWRYGARAQYYQPVVAAGVVFVGSTDIGSYHPFGIGSNDFLTALDARTGALYWRTSADVEGMPLLFSP